MKDFREENFYELLDLTPGASQQEVEAAYQRARRIFSPDSVVTYALFQAEELTLFRRRIEEAFRALGNLERRRKYDQELTRLEGSLSLPEAEAEAEAEADQAPVQEARPSPVSGLPLFERPALQQTEAVGKAEEAQASEGDRAPAQGEDPQARDAREGREDQGAREPETGEGEMAAGANAAPVAAAKEAATTSSPPGPSPLGEPSPGTPPSPGDSRPAAALDSQPPTEAPPASQPPATSQPPAECLPGLPPIDERTVFDGPLLRQVREARGLSLEAVQNLTKINIFYLRRLEENDLAELPAPVYVRGYLRQLGRLLKLDADRLVAWYASQVKES
jgi:curved DNA-binding protein CbpA